MRRRDFLHAGGLGLLGLSLSDLFALKAAGAVTPDTDVNCIVLMLVGVDSSDSLIETLRGQRIAAIVVGLGFAALIMGTIASAVVGPDGTVAAVGLETASRTIRGPEPSGTSIAPSRAGSGYQRAGGSCSEPSPM